MATNAALGDAYQVELRETLIPAGCGTLSLAFFGIVTLYIGIDWLAFPKQYSEFLVARVLTNAVFAWIYLKGRHAWPAFSQSLLFLSGASMLLFMVYSTGAGDSAYYPAFMILFFGSGLLLPLTERQAATLCGVVLLAYGAYPWLESQPTDWREYLIRNTFLFFSAALSVTSCYVQTRARLRDLRQRSDLRTAFEDLKRAEVQLVQAERLAAVGELSAGIAHEINNPVNFVLNASRSLRERFAELRSSVVGAEPLRNDQGSALIAEIEELLEIIREGAERTGRLASDLRDFGSKGTQGPRAVDAGDCIRSTVALVGPAFSQVNVAISLQLEPYLPRVNCDSSELKQVLLNLLKNAAESLEKSGGLIEVKAWVRDSTVCIAVSDNGPGIPEDLVEDIFEPFFTTKPAGKGTGLGLSICRQILEKWDGKIILSSSAAGSTFWLELPALEVADGS